MCGKGLCHRVGLGEDPRRHMQMPSKLALIYPPTCDPTAPYLAVPMLTGFLRSHGRSVLPIDANVEAWDDLLTPSRLQEVALRLESQLAKLEAQPQLAHQDQLR